MDEGGGGVSGVWVLAGEHAGGHVGGHVGRRGVSTLLNGTGVVGLIGGVGGAGCGGEFDGRW
jgi:hypothetical protein